MEISIAHIIKDIELIVSGKNPDDDVVIKLLGASNNLEAFKVLFDNYEWCVENNLIISELEKLTKKDLSPFYIWVIKKYLLGQGMDNILLYIIELHKKVIAGEEVSYKKWDYMQDLVYYSSSNPDKIANKRSKNWYGLYTSAWDFNDVGGACRHLRSFWRDIRSNENYYLETVSNDIARHLYNYLLFLNHLV